MDNARIAVIGGGINGVMSAWSVIQAGHQVDLYERGRLMQETSCRSTKLIHGGLRYLENGEFGLVRESLHERYWWLNQAPHLCRPLPLILPIYRGVSRSRHLVRLGLWLYDTLAGRLNMGRHAWLPRAELVARAPELKREGLSGGFLFYDVQMDDYQLGMWAAEQARSAGVVIHEQTPIHRVELSGRFETKYGSETAHAIVNVAGPWCTQLLEQSGLQARYRLDLVRGSHLVLDRPLAEGYFLQVPGERRICFVLPWQGRTLLGTTEIRQELQDPLTCSAEEEAYLLGVHASAFNNPAQASEIVERFAGLRPLLDSGSSSPGSTTRESALDVQGRILSVFGGKWTTSRLLGNQVGRRVQAMLANDACGSSLG
jgi:glycerol-3-phosphate dehydrogenase